ncbi:tryptophan-rich sensory protein [Xylanimonas oleitrophica]|uniref:Tryptophan-rich sensory protein n=1 Tax=Xylanimonas oleitrophica TaxID=2607479 RepID=A0A2W5Y7G0_9MICO|nr:TspO/MBR family protein [Xylanimonas oleitrophica]PZR54304.1 tryptophan-rich sensory protein [Xylanimonas oleitrophica]
MEPRVVLSSVGLPLAGAVAGSVASARGTRSRWYRRLRKPAIQPPGAVFPVVWSALYAAVAGASLVAQAHGDAASRSSYRAALAVNMTLNAGWCWTFFVWHRLGASVVVSGALAVSSADLARRAAATSTGAGAALVPYAGWTAFATVLADAVRRANPGR